MRRWRHKTPKPLKIGGKKEIFPQAREKGRFSLFPWERKRLYIRETNFPHFLFPSERRPEFPPGKKGASLPFCPGGSGTL